MRVIGFKPADCLDALIEMDPCYGGADLPNAKKKSAFALQKFAESKRLALGVGQNRILYE